MKGHVLVLDDNRIDVSIATTVIERSGYACHGFTEQSEAMTWLSENTPALIFLDIQMPGLSGYDMILSIRALPGKSAVPIVMISGMNQSEDVMKAIKLGANDYIVKPLDPMILQEKLQNVASQSGEFHSVELPQSFEIAALVSKSVRIISISEFGVKIISPSKISPNDTIQLTGLPEAIFGKDSALLRCLSSEKNEQEDFVVNLTFVGMNETQRQQLRKNCRQIWIKIREGVA